MVKHMIRRGFVHKIVWLCLLLILFGVQNVLAIEYAAGITLAEKNLKKFDFEKIKIPVTVKNRGTITWNSLSKKGPVFLSYHLLSQKTGKILKYDNKRTILPQPISPGGTAIVNLQVESLPEGKYILQIDLVAEGITWFQASKFSDTNCIISVVKSSPHPMAPVFEFENFVDKLVWHIDGEDEINYCSLLTNKTIEGNFQAFVFKGHRVSGFFAGDGYPQIWARDSATIMPVVRYTYPKSALVSWIKAFLSIQRKNGELQDWIGYGNTFGKNTVESDQESSVVIAAYEISKTLGYDWLRQDIQSRTILLRLHDALKFLFIQRRDATTGLIKSGLTADWGDVSNEFPDQRAVDLHPKSHEVVGIYTNAMAFGAATKLAFLMHQQGYDHLASYWKKESDELRDNINRYLWQKDKQFFRIHHHVNFGPHKHFNEGNIFPMGGNAVAIEMGVTTSNQADNIISQAVFRQKLFNFSTISGVLLPPYPKDFFINPILNDYFEYQNGGQWDWFGGRLGLQMFRCGHPLALEKLREICKKAFQNKGFYEWDTMDGKGQGSSFYTGGAATISNMIIQGLFGIDWDYKSIRIKPDLAAQNGYIYVPQVATGKFFSYAFHVGSPSADKVVVKFSFGSNVNNPKTLILPASYNKYMFARGTLNGNAVKERPNSDSIKISLSERRSELVVEYMKRDE